MQLARAELAATISDFPKLSQTIRAAFTPDGLRLDFVAAGSLFARIGLHAGDVVTAVDNQPLRSLDDAANLYARADTARGLQIHVQRAHAAILLNVAIH